MLSYHSFISESKILSERMTKSLFKEDYVMRRGPEGHRNESRLGGVCVGGLSFN